MISDQAESTGKPMSRNPNTISKQAPLRRPPLRSRCSVTGCCVLVLEEDTEQDGGKTQTNRCVAGDLHFLFAGRRTFLDHAGMSSPLVSHPRRITLVVVLLSLGLSQSFSGEATVTFEGERFERGYIGNPTPDEHIIEFLPKTETRETWSKMVTYRYERLPGLGNDPKKAAQLTANTTKSFSARAETRISTDGNEAILDSTSLF